MSRNASRALIAFAVFVLAGPAIGSITFGLIVTIVTQVTDPGTGLTFLYASVLFLALAYVSGGAQAAFVGAITAFVVWRKGRSPLWVPLGAAALAAGYTQVSAHEGWGLDAIMIAVHLLAALACWLILRRVLGWGSR